MKKIEQEIFLNCKEQGYLEIDKIEKANKTIRNLGKKKCCKFCNNLISYNNRNNVCYKCAMKLGDIYQKNKIFKKNIKNYNENKKEDGLQTRTRCT